MRTTTLDVVRHLRGATILLALPFAILAAACGSEPAPSSPDAPTGGGGSSPVVPTGKDAPPTPTIVSPTVGPGSAACREGEVRACDAPASGPARGICKAGVQTCERVASGELSSTHFGACVGAVGPRAETCNGLDDDCNGLVDDGISCGPPVVDGGSPPTDPIDSGPPPSPCDERCTGQSFVIDQTAKYGLWVKVVLCSHTRYDLFLGPSAQGPFSKIGDLTNGGQDHCELVSSAFTLGNEADIKSGNCPTCDIGRGGRAHLYPNDFGTTLYYRALIGDPFKYTTDITKDAFNADTACWYECGVSF